MQPASATSLTGSSPSIPPKENQIEVSLIGPGYGESVLIHYGHRNWIIVDSCIDPVSSLAAPLNYLKNLGVNLVQDVRLIVATHWHDDHIRGLGSVVEECPSARFVCSGALRFEEFLALVESASERSMMVRSPSGVREFSVILRALEKRVLTSGSNAGQPHFAFADRLLWRDNDSPIPCQVFSLSPSDHSLQLAYLEIARLLPQPRRRKNLLIAQRPNHVAVVLWLQIGDSRILLGSDLENTGHPSAGWEVIVSSTTRPEGRASIIKIPHHGSSNGHHPQVWADMLHPNPMAVLSPFSRGKTTLPTSSDVQRICSQTTNCYSTAIPREGKTSRRSAAALKTIRETVRWIREVSGEIGQVRLRGRASPGGVNQWDVELLGSAISLHQRQTPPT